MPNALDPTESAYRLFVPKQTCTADVIYFDIFNATGSGYDIHVSSIIPVVSGAVDTAIVLGPDLYLQRTSAIGTNGTTAGFNLSAITSASITGLSYGAAQMPNGITARLTPDGGATAGALIGFVSCYIDDDGAGAYIAPLYNLVTLGDDDGPPLIVTPGTGLRVIQGSETISEGTIGFNVAFGLKAR